MLVTLYLYSLCMMCQGAKSDLVLQRDDGVDPLQVQRCSLSLDFCWHCGGQSNGAERCNERLSLSLFSSHLGARLKSIRERYLIKWREEQFVGKSLILGSAFRSPILGFPGRADYFLFIDFISAVRVRRPPCGWSPPTSSEPVLSLSLLGRSGQFLLMCLTQRRDNKNG